MAHSRLVVIMVLALMVCSTASAQQATDRRAGENVTEYRLRALEACVAKMEAQQNDIKDRLIELDSDVRYMRQGVTDIKHSVELLAENSKGINTNDLIAYVLLGLFGLGGGGLITAKRMNTKHKQEEAQ